MKRYYTPLFWLLITFSLGIYNSTNAQPYGCSGSGFPSIPNPGTVDIAVWNGSTFTPANIISYFNNEWTNGWYNNVDNTVTLNAFPYSSANAPTDVEEYAEWLQTGIIYMLTGDNGGAISSFNHTPKLSHAAQCVSYCVANIWNPSSGLPPHGCITGNPIGDYISLLGAPGSCWNTILLKEQIAVMPASYTNIEAVGVAFIGWVGTDGGSNSGHFNDLVDCNLNANHLLGLGIESGTNGKAVVITHIQDATGSGGTNVGWFNKSGHFFKIVHFSWFLKS